MKIGPAILLSILIVIYSLPAAVIESAEIQQIAAALRHLPAGFGEPIANRPAWVKLAALPSFQKQLSDARATAQAPLPDSPDELFLDYSKTGNRDRWQKVAGLRRGRIPAFTIAECLENKGHFLAPVDESIRAICAEKTWVMPAHDGALKNFHGRTTELDLGSTMLAWDLATADYLLGDKLPPSTRRLLHENLDRRIFSPFRKTVESGGNEIHWLRATHNWNAVCLAGVTGSALATMDSREDRALFVAAARHYIQNFLRGFTPDGYCSEGLGYWNYGFGYFVLLAEAVRQQTDGKIDLLAEPAARGPAFFGQRSEILNGIYPSIADCHPGTKPGEQLMNYLARRFEMAGSRKSINPTARGSLYSVCMDAFLPAQLPVLPNPGAAESSLRTWFKDGGVLICRPLPNTAPFAVALKGGHNAEHHNHNDVGTFMIVSGNAMVLCDPGAEVYTARTFSSHRYDSDVLNSFGHPVPVVAGQLQRTGIQAKGKVLRTDFSDEQDTISLDITSAYAVPSLKSLERTFAYARQQLPSLIVIDKVEFDTPESFETALLTWGRWQRDSQDLLINDEGGAVRIKIETAGQPFEIKSKRLQADVGNAKYAERIGIALSTPVKSALIKLTITPVPAK